MKKRKGFVSPSSFDNSTTNSLSLHHLSHRKRARTALAPVQHLERDRLDLEKGGEGEGKSVVRAAFFW